MIDIKALGVAPLGLLEKSREHVQHVIYFGCNKYIEYLMYNGVSHHAGTVDYSRICIQ